MTDETIKKALKNGEDWQAREEICKELSRLIYQSHNGEVGIGNMAEQLEKAYIKSLKYLAIFTNN